MKGATVGPLAGDGRGAEVAARDPRRRRVRFELAGLALGRVCRRGGGAAGGPASRDFAFWTPGLP